MLQAYPDAGDCRVTAAALAERGLAGHTWIDLQDPTPEEVAEVERACGLRVPSREALEEIEATSRIRTEGATRPHLDRLFTHAHDLKGLGATYEFPLVTRIAGSLCKLLGEGEARLNTPMPLVDAHVNAIRAAVRDNIRDSDNPTGAALAGALERHTAEYLATRD